ncbi:hypothetical protein [Photobacterium sp. 1_MG-2023]|uniref:hypothetical protein n=1 Tax=Photobacterium sp. 1_MG-2023 TaxID=3062646 RepID=UPI0026E1E001|nr:hypothetical protein [Photobacterium sp. 1_MG-2023]MDO6708836.1 hypothetical protein [Photobacterium sp. 1_MG-2023]
MLHADTGGEPCRLVLTVVGVVEIAEAQAAGVERQVAEILAGFVGGSNERAGNIGVTRNFDLSLAAGGEVYKSGELDLGFEGYGNVEGLREVDAPGTELEFDVIPGEPPLPEQGRSICGSVTYAAKNY